MPPGLHPVQERLASLHGSQCGFCSPGMVMAIYGALSRGESTAEQLENSLDGNLCRCTGYVRRGKKKKKKEEGKKTLPHPTPPPPSPVLLQVILHSNDVLTCWHDVLWLLYSMK